MSITFKRAVAGITLSAAGIAGTLGVGAMTAAPAEAKVDSGTYKLSSTAFGVTSKGKVVVRGNRMTFTGPINTTLHLHQTRDGAYADYGITRYVFTKRGNGYTGKTVVGPVTLNTMTLTKH
ncbi:MULTISPECIES: hypothetical protein [Mycobacteriales]|uniref:MspA n=1 Tax=Tsukamurella paurometabola TaxID=2061 RepID=A0ABS5NHH1_TSUPA|nr:MULTISPECIES: hypothetical protein [Mycobacteriales]MBS4103072.1 hypothetical protein [Tsukamurella paurometabola]MCZ0911064.1 hypothetical protein [Gordonia amicalis]